jgi:hypothetical protein
VTWRPKHRNVSDFVLVLQFCPPLLNSTWRFQSFGTWRRVDWYCSDCSEDGGSRLLQRSVPNYRPTVCLIYHKTRCNYKKKLSECYFICTRILTDWLIACLPAWLTDWLLTPKNEIFLERLRVYELVNSRLLRKPNVYCCVHKSPEFRILNRINPVPDLLSHLSKTSFSIIPIILFTPKSCKQPFPSGFPTETCVHFPSPYVPYAPPILSPWRELPYIYPKLLLYFQHYRS